MKPAETFPVGEYIREEMAERGWSAQRLAKMMRVDIAYVRGLLDGTQCMTPMLAERLGASLGTSGAMWVNLYLAHKKGSR